MKVGLVVILYYSSDDYPLLLYYLSLRIKVNKHIFKIEVVIYNATNIIAKVHCFHGFCQSLPFSIVTKLSATYNQSDKK